MARQGVSQQQIFETAQALLESGQSVTVSSVRDKLGTGSYSTISTHLATWREANDNRQVADIPDLPASVDTALRQVWGIAWKESQALIKAERDGLELARRDIEQEKQDMGKEIARLEAENNAQGNELKKAMELLSNTQKTLSEAQIAENDLKIDNARLDERVKSSENRAGELQTEIDKLHDRLKEATTKAQEKPKKE